MGLKEKADTGDYMRRTVENAARVMSELKKKKCKGGCECDCPACKAKPKGKR